MVLNVSGMVITQKSEPPMRHQALSVVSSGIIRDCVECIRNGDHAEERAAHAAPGPFSGIKWYHSGLC